RRDDDPSASIFRAITDRFWRRGQSAINNRPPDNRGRDASGSKTGSGPQRISWRRNLYALWAAQLLAVMGFSLRVPFLPFFLGELGVDSVEGQTLWAGIISAGGAGVMA